jgi:hypothetical protein
MFFDGKRSELFLLLKSVSKKPKIHVFLPRMDGPTCEHGLDGQDHLDTFGNFGAFVKPFWLRAPHRRDSGSQIQILP